jgi:hypothetical protein
MSSPDRPPPSGLVATPLRLMVDMIARGEVTLHQEHEITPPQISEPRRVTFAEALAALDLRGPIVLPPAYEFVILQPTERPIPDAEPYPRHTGEE